MREFLINIYKVFIRELQRIRRNSTYWALLLVLPCAAFAFFAIFFSHGAAENLPVAVVDCDRSDLSRQVVSMIDQTQQVQVAFEAQDMNEAQRLIREGRVYAAVLIPSGFGRDILGNVQTRVELYNSGTNLSTNGLIAKDVQTAVTTFGTGVQLQILQKRGLTAHQAMSQAMPIRFTKHILFNPYVNYAYYLVPCFLPMMLMIFAILSTIYAAGTELKEGTAREWLDTAGGSIVAATAGKFLPVTLAMMLAAAAMYFVVFNVAGTPLNGSDTVIWVATAALVVSYQAIGLFILSATDNMRLALSLGGGYSVLAFTFSGLTFPVMAMEPAMQWLSNAFPFTFYMRIMVDQALRGAPVGVSLPWLACMVLFWTLPLLTINRLRKLCSNGRYWGKS